jgi:ubiquinone/menaquinone biosynthesis C-methylase UbiE
MFFSPFGKEYAWAPRWNLFERLYIRAFGVVDLPSRLRARLVIHAVKKYPAKAILDFGCGTGIYSFYFSRSPDVEVKGIDVDESRIEESKLIMQNIRRNNTEFYAGNGHGSLRIFKNESFDSALAVEVLQYVSDLDGTLSEMYRVLKPGGYLIGHVPVTGYLREAEHTLFDDNNIHRFLDGSGFEVIELTSTFGGGIKQLCKLYDKIANSKHTTALMYPFLVAFSYVFEVEAAKGDYRFFVARKRAEDDESKVSLTSVLL